MSKTITLDHPECPVGDKALGRLNRKERLEKIINKIHKNFSLWADREISSSTFAYNQRVLLGSFTKKLKKGS